MQVMNCTKAPITIAGTIVIPPGAMRSFPDDQWATLRVRPAVVHWLKVESLKEISAEAEDAADGEAPAPKAGKPSKPGRGPKAKPAEPPAGEPPVAEPDGSAPVDPEAPTV